MMRENERRIMLHIFYYIGISGAGKTTVADWRATEDEKLIDSDLVRAKLWGDASDQQHPEKVFDTMFNETCAALRQGCNVHYVATNLAMRHRLNFIHNIRKFFSPDEVELNCKVVVAPIEECLERNAQRSRQVPENVIIKQGKSFQCPVEGEGWTDIEVIRNSALNGEKYQRQLLNKMIDFGDQKNSHHSLNLAQHCLACLSNLTQKNILDKNLLDAGFFHDIGKIYTRVYWEKDDFKEAHYPGHGEIGSYAILAGDINIETAQLICYHMMLFGDESAQTTWKNRLGTKLWDKLLILHECDMSAK